MMNNMSYGFPNGVPGQYGNDFNNFGGGCGYGNNGFTNFNAQPMIDPNTASWFLGNVNQQLVNYVTAGRMQPQIAEMIMAEIKSAVPMYIQYLLKQTNGNIGSGTPEQLTALIGTCMQNAENRVKARLTQAAAAQSNAATNVMMTNAFGSGNNGGWNQPPSPVVNNGFQNQPLPIQPQAQEEPSMVHIGPRRYRNTPPPAVQTYMNNEAAQDMSAQMTPPMCSAPVDPTPFQSRMTQAARTGNIDMPRSTMTPEEIERLKKKTEKLRNALMNAEPIRAGATCLLEPFDLKDTETWDSTYTDRIGYTRCRIEKGEIDPNSEEWVNMAAASEEYWKARGVKWDNAGDTSSEQVVESKIEARKELPVMEYTEVPLNDHALVDATDKDNFKGLVTEGVSHISVKKDNVPIGNTIAINLVNDTLVADEDAFLDDVMDGSLTSAVLLKDGNNTIDFNSTYDNTCVTLDYVVLQAVDIPYAEMSKFYNLMNAEASRGTVEHFDKFYNGFTAILYDMPRKWSEEIEHIIIGTLNQVFDRRFRSFKDAMTNGPALTKWVNIYDILQSRNMTFMTTNTTTYFKKLILDTVKQLFAHELINPETPSGRDAIVSSSSTIDLVHKYYKAPITVDDIEAWDPESDKDQINKLNMNLQKFSAMVIGKSVMISDCKPQYINPGEWLFTPADNHLDLYMYLVYRQFNYNTAMLRDAYLIVDGVLAKKPVVAKFKLGASADMHYGYYLDV